MDKRKKSVGVTAFMIGLILFVVLFSAASGVAVKFGMKLVEAENAARVASNTSGKTFVAVIDAGHGGEDGGCCNGIVLEKDINLDIAKRVSGLCSLLGIETRLMRDDDRMLYDLYGDLNDYTGKKKVYDLKNRVRFTREENADIYVGIHINKFPDSNCRGMQIYYADKIERSEALADAVRNKSIEVLGEDGKRPIKKGKSSIFVLSHASCPAILVECGFISNEKDLERLTSDEGKLDAAVIMASGIFAYSTEFDT